jgi:hypothetical protein
MHARIAAILLTGTAVLALASSATPLATASSTWTVTPGGSSTGTTNSFGLADGGTGGGITCPDDGAFVWHHPGPNPSGFLTGLILACTGPQRPDLHPAANACLGGERHLLAGTGVTIRTITGIHATVSGTGCNATVDGTSPGADNGQVSYTYTNSTGKLAIVTTGGNLHVYNVSGCTGLFRSGDTATFSASYTLSPKQTITSP